MEELWRDELARKRNPQPLSEEYHRARRQLLLWSGILFAWELIGIDVAGVSDDSSNVGSLFRALSEPDAIPWVIIVLVLYFLFRLTVEWYHCDAYRRVRPVSRVDIAVSYIIALASLALYGVQHFVATTVAEFVKSPSAETQAFFVVAGCFIASVISLSLVLLVQGRSTVLDLPLQRRMALGVFSVLCSAAIVGGAILFLGVIAPSGFPALVSFLLCALLGIVPAFHGTGLQEYIGYRALSNPFFSEKERVKEKPEGSAE